MVNANEVAVTILLTLTDGRGRVISSQTINAESWPARLCWAWPWDWSGQRRPGLAQMYADYCSQRGQITTRLIPCARLSDKRPW
jgi:hypothetical protein